mmetsp:Transcript_12354/g.19117  ORF Transcript_12354/g.19117 Transcript_12354/m.19117 type:complete len:108 (-) Transcript_12354:551-874(-)
MEQNDFDSYSSYEDWPLPPDVSLEARKTDVTIDPVLGTGGELVAGPSELRPGQFAWNCFTIRRVQTGKYVSIRLTWNDLGQDVANPGILHTLQNGCDDDPHGSSIQR